ncbi:MAG: hypothetical protein U9N04_00565 [Patescibacteria group bacterium]|nr:hypothetical protein [Patescibacteria group bacterium]
MIQKKENLILGSALEKGNDIKSKMKILENNFLKKFNIAGNVFKEEVAILSRPENEEDIFLGNDKIFLVGEAAGFISSSTGEGISFAMRSGYNCAKALNENFENPFSLYRKFSESLIKETKEKIDKANVFSDPRKRAEILNREVRKGN